MSGLKRTLQRHPGKVAAGGAAAAVALITAISTPLIATYEGTVLATYRDPVSILTSCTGHTGPELKMGQVFTREECRRTLDSDQLGVIRRIGACTKVDVPIDSFAAFTSFSFNVGSGVYCQRFAPMVNRGDLAGACARMSRYVYAGKTILPGLVRRRARERALCELGLS